MKAMIVLMLTAALSGCSFFQSELDKTNKLKTERGMPTAQDRTFSIAIGTTPTHGRSLDETIKAEIGKLLTDEDFVITYLNSSISEIDQIRTAIDDTGIDYVLLIEIAEPSNSNSKSRIIGTSKNMIAKQIRVDANFKVYEISSDKIVSSFSASGSAESKRILSIKDGHFDVSDPAIQDAVSALAKNVSVELLNIGMISRNSDPTPINEIKNQQPKTEANDASLIIYK